MRTIFIILIIFLSSKACEIHTSQPNYNTMVLASQDGWYYNVIKRYGKRMKQKSFAEAFVDNDRDVKRYIKNTICAKLNWNGVVNYNLKWQITNDEYIFTVSFDAFKYK